MNQPEQETEWTVMLYLAGNYEGDVLDEGESRVMTMLKQLEELHDIDAVRVIACFSNSQTNGHTTIRRITHRLYGSDEQITSEILQDLGSASMASPETFRALLNEGVYHYPAHHTVLAIEGSGDGWEGCCTDNSTGVPAILRIEDIRAVLNDFVEHDLDDPIDVLVWMSPEMSTVEVAIEFADLADYMIASPMTTPASHYSAIRTWCMDLTSNPLMPASELGNRILDAVHQSAILDGNAVSVNLFRMPSVPRIASAIDEFAGWCNLQEDEYLSLLQDLRDGAWSSDTDDSNHVDLTAFLSSLETDMTLNQHADLMALVSNLRQVTEECIIGRIQSLDDGYRDGVMLYYPLEIDSTTYGKFKYLQIAETSPQWSTFLEKRSTQSGSRVQVSGLVRWPGRDLAQLDCYLFLNETPVGALLPIEISEISLTSGSIWDESQFTTSFSMTVDSLWVNIGIFVDLDRSGTLSTGDRFGVYSTPPALRDWLEIRPGDVISDLNILLNYTR